MFCLFKGVVSMHKKEKKKKKRLCDLLKKIMSPNGLKGRVSLAFQSCVNLDSQEQWTGLANGKNKSFTEEGICLGLTT